MTFAPWGLERPTYNLHKTMLTIRPATPADVPRILTFIRDLATYEREPDAVLATEADLLRDGFGPIPRFHCLIAELEDNTPQASPSTSTTTPPGAATRHPSRRPLRQPRYRGKGIGKALITRVAAIAVAEGCPRFQWGVLEWNTPSIDFYHQIGAVLKSEWKGMQVSGDALAALAAQNK